MPDSITPFLFERRNVRGAWVEIQSGVADMLGHRNYSPDVRRLVGESCVAIALLAAQTAFKNRLSLQFQHGHGPLKLLVAQSDPGLNVRGMAKADRDARGVLDELMNGGVLGLVVEGARGGQNYQALVQATGDTLAIALERYFSQSEQLPTRLCFAGGADRLRGLLIQRLPVLAVKNHRQGTATEHVPVHLHLGQGVAELFHRGRCRLVDQHLLGLRLG